MATFSSQIKYADAYFYIRKNNKWKFLDYSPKGDMPEWLKTCNAYEPEGTYISGGHGNLTVGFKKKDGKKCPEIWTKPLSFESERLIISHFENKNKN